MPDDQSDGAPAPSEFWQLRVICTERRWGVMVAHHPAEIGDPTYSLSPDKIAGVESKIIKAMLDAGHHWWDPSADTGRWFVLPFDVGTELVVRSGIEWDILEWSDEYF